MLRVAVWLDGTSTQILSLLLPLRCFLSGLTCKKLLHSIILPSTSFMLYFLPHKCKCTQQFSGCRFVYKIFENLLFPMNFPIIHYFALVHHLKPQQTTSTLNSVMRKCERGKAFYLSVCKIHASLALLFLK